MRVKVTIAYDGSRFSGYQRQNSGVKTVANRLEIILKSLNIYSKINASGRTDSGVHATNQVVDFEIPPFWEDLKKLKHSLNKQTKPYIFIKEIIEVNDDFHSRFSAKKRVYRYLITDKKISVFDTAYILKVKKIDQGLLGKAIKIFEGEHDFKYFKKGNGELHNSVRIIYKVKSYKYKDIYVCSFEANAYLRSQIRMMMQFLLDICEKKRSVDELEEQLACKKRYSTDMVSPVGLYLSSVKY